MFQILFAGFLLGISSSLHCVGMCGPLAMALPVSHKNKSAIILNSLLYHGGRVFTYTIIGIVTGIASHGFSMSGLQQEISIIMGITLFSIGLYSVISGSRPKTFALVRNLQLKLSPAMVRLLNNPSGASCTLLGICNGILPCGMVYLAIAAALSLGSAAESAFFMTFFGIGTMPAMLSISFFGARFKTTTRITFKQISPYLTILVGILLVLRGLNLGIPLLSPGEISLTGSAISCH